MGKPNLIYIFADQLAYNRLGYNGDLITKTPFIDSFSKDSLNVDNCVSNHPVCAPYRASLLTGKYTTSTGMVINEIRINPHHISFANVLNDNGYNTSYMGKWHLYANELGHHYNVKNSYIPVGENRLGFKRFVGYNFRHEYTTDKAYYHRDSNEKIFVKEYEPNEQVKMAIEEIKYLNNENKPFAFFLSIGTPHDPWVKDNVPIEYYNKFIDADTKLPINYQDKNDKHADMWARLNKKERKNLTSWMKVYYAMVNNLDDNINYLFTEIKKMGLYDNSIIVFTSDHGEMFGAHGRRAKNIFYDEASRVPFLIKYDKLLKNQKTDAIFSSVDIMPTLLSMMDISIPNDVEGRNKKEELMGLKEENEFDGSLLMGTGPTAIYGKNREYRAYRTKRYTYAIYRSDKEELLFDNIKDPYQMNNLINEKDYQEIKEKLKQMMYSEMKRIGDDFESNRFYKKYWVKNRIIKEHLLRREEIKKHGK